MTKSKEKIVIQNNDDLQSSIDLQNIDDNYPDSIFLNSQEYYISGDTLDIDEDQFDNIKLSDLPSGLLIITKFANIRIINDTTIEANSMISIPNDTQYFQSDFIQDFSDIFDQLINHNDRYRVSENFNDYLERSYDIYYSVSGISLKEVSEKVYEEMGSLESKIKEMLERKYNPNQIFQDAFEYCELPFIGLCYLPTDVLDIIVGKFIVDLSKYPLLKKQTPGRNPRLILKQKKGILK